MDHHASNDRTTADFQGCNDKESWWRVLRATVALLNHAQYQLDLHKTEIKNLRTRVTQLERLSRHDDLTGLLNRRGFEDALSAALDRARRKHSAGGVLVVIDLDGFKQINDHLGHAAGDACLTLVGKTLSQDLRRMDAAARIGGDEFVLILSETEPRHAAGRAHRISHALNNLSFIHEGREVFVQASVGLRAFNADDTAEDILREADAKMYAVKRARAPRLSAPSIPVSSPLVSAVVPTVATATPANSSPPHERRSAPLG